MYGDLVTYLKSSLPALALVDSLNVRPVGSCDLSSLSLFKLLLLSLPPFSLVFNNPYKSELSLLQQVTRQKTRSVKIKTTILKMPVAESVPQTLYDKVLAAHIVDEKLDGTVLLYIGM